MTFPALLRTLPACCGRLAAAATLAALLPHGADAAGWSPQETVAPYAIDGQTGIDLYRSIGEKGPAIGPTRAIAHTTFKLTWRRDYQQRGADCVLASAVPKLVITYTLPKPRRKLTGEVAVRWKTFIDGIAAHERVHGADIIAMVRAIERESVGLTAVNDPGCRKIRQDLTERLGRLSNEQRAKSRAFDQVEMSDGGNVQRLILALVAP
ncbi:DUF922 domain-containing Zn-dependent protease [Rhizobium sp. SG2393]|uniref:DUF922 domain-containing Zn-dependent protease n=1 Tax=Rhizobium sp. SG2393 TaxID=3276279 RepID=UPI00366B0B51